MSNFTENILEQAIIDLFIKQGYEYSFGLDLHRRTKDILFLDDLKSYLNDKYNNSLTDNEIQKIINEISFVSSNPTAPIRFNHPSPISCGPNLLDIQETAKYTPRHKKEVLIN